MLQYLNGNNYLRSFKFDLPTDGLVDTADVFDHRSADDADVDVEGNDVEPKSREEVDEDEEEEDQGGEELQAGPVCQLQSKPSSRNR